MVQGTVEKVGSRFRHVPPADWAMALRREHAGDRKSPVDSVVD
jgi:hypothetical protein